MTVFKKRSYRVSKWMASLALISVLLPVMTSSRAQAADVGVLAAAGTVGGSVVRVAGLAYLVYQMDRDGKAAKKKGYAYSDGAVDRLVKNMTYGTVPGYIETQEAVATAFTKLGNDPSLEGSILWNAQHSRSPAVERAATIRKSQQLEMGKMMYGSNYQLPASSAK